MKWPFRILLPLAIHLLLLCTVSARSVSAVDRQEIATPNWSAYGIPEGYYSANSLCGVTSVYTILREFRIDTSYEHVLAKMPPGIYGNTMQQIIRFLGENSALEVSPIRCNARELYRELSQTAGQRAIINLADHWVVVQNASGDAFEIVDFPRKYFMPVDVIDDLWEGYCVVMRKQSSSLTGRSLGIGLLFFSIVGLITLIVHNTWDFRRRKARQNTALTRGGFSLPS